MTVTMDMVAGLYGWNWAAHLERQNFLRRLNSAAHPHFRWWVEPPPAPTGLTLEFLREYAELLDQEFEVFEYRAISFEPHRDAVLVSGSLHAVTKLSHEPFTRPFRHRWRLRRGILVDVREARTHPHGERKRLSLTE